VAALRTTGYGTFSLGVFLACVGFLKLVEPLVSKGQASYVPPDLRRAQQVVGAHEPRIGDDAPSGLLQAGDVTAVVVLSDCGECSVNQVTSGPKLKGIDRLVYLAPQPNDPKIKDLGLATGGNILPATQSLVKALDAFFVPRLYVYGRNGKLVYFQPVSRAWKQVVSDYNESISQ